MTIGLSEEYDAAIRKLAEERASKFFGTRGPNVITGIVRAEFNRELHDFAIDVIQDLMARRGMTVTVGVGDDDVSPVVGLLKG